MADCRSLIAVVCVVLLCISMNIGDSVSTCHLHSPVPLIQYASTLLTLLRPNSHEFSPSTLSPLPNSLSQRREREGGGGEEE